ncbi:MULTISPECIES: FHA domain-containing protein [unclassified Variovorax]|uniref:FHA domain-containing protein n=1 Tax=unclassified Variovorax TaxID=663243 RepID=UPI001BD1FC2D|nr:MULTISPECIES: FHA domain-containing protein [unclassified Variovorax]
MPKLIVMTHPGKTKLVPLAAADTRIGRANSNDVVIDSDRVSRFHATLTVESGAVWIRDLDSSNGTFVNGHRITSRALSNGDTILIGDCQMRFLAGEQNVTPAEALRLMTIPGALMDLDKLRKPGPR